MRIRRVITVFVVAVAAGGLSLYAVAQIAVGAMVDRIVSVDSVPVVDVIIVPGASVLPSGKPSDVLTDRLIMAHAVYRAGKAEKIFLSGDGRLEEYNEVVAMHAYLVDAGVPETALVDDPAGYDTFATMEHAVATFGAVPVVIATQTFHLPRAMYLAQNVGMDAYGVAAERQPYVKDDLFAARERFANVKAFIDVHAHLW